MNIEESIDNVKFIIGDLKASNYNQTFIQAIETLLTAYEKEKEKNKELESYCNDVRKEMNEENKRCMLLAVENQDLKEKNKRLTQCHYQYEEMTGIDLLLPSKEE